MRYLKTIGLCLAAICMIAAITAGTASAKKPEWGKCVKTEEKPKYTDANCQNKAKSGETKEYAWVKGKTLPDEPFTGHSEGSGGILSSSLNLCEGAFEGEEPVTRKQCEEEGGEPFESPEGSFVAVECENEENTGVAYGKNRIKEVHVKFTGCALFGEVACNSEGDAEGEINTSELKGELGYIEEGAGVGVKLEPVVKHGSFASFYCPGFGLGTVVGVGNKKEGTAWLEENGTEKHGGNDQIISPITPINEMTPKFKQKYTVNYETVQNIPNKLDGPKLSVLEDYIFTEFEGYKRTNWSRAGEEITNVNTPEEEGEIKA